MGSLFSSIQSRLTLIVGGGIGLLLLVASLSVLQLKTHINEYHALLSTNAQYERDVGKLNYNFKVQVQEWKNLLLRGKDPEKYQKYWGEFSKLQQEIQTSGNSLVGKLPDDEGKKKLQEFLSAHASAFKKYEEGARSFSQADFDPTVGDKAVTGIDREPSKLLSECETFIANQLFAVSDELNSSSSNVVFWSEVLVGGFGIGIIILALMTLKASLVSPLMLIVHHIEILSQGNFSHRLQLNQEGEIGQLSRNINRMQDSLIEMIHAMKKSSSTLTNASNKITKTAQDITTDTNSSQNSTDQVAAAINEMSATVQEVANNASGAAVAAQDADSNARKGMTIMDNAIQSIQQLSHEVDNVSTAMHQLETETARIGGVLDVIKSVAEQTNLLALNAAIEAARAGEQGRGFAVVADEVRALAKRTQESTAEIQHIIEAVQSGASKAMQAMKSSQSKTHSTCEMAGQAGQAISEITNAVARIHSMNTQIATAAEEQSYAAEEINRNVVRVVNLVQNAATNAQKSTHVASELDTAARDLERQVAQFNL